MMVMTVIAMILDLQKYIAGGHTLLTLVALSIFLLSLWLVVEAVLRFRKDTVTLRSAPAKSMAEGD